MKREKQNENRWAFRPMSKNGKKNPWDQSEKARETIVGMIYGTGKFWVWSGTEMEWCMVKVVMMMMTISWWEKYEKTVTGTHYYRRSQDFVWGCTFFCHKSWRPFLVVALTDRLNIPPNLSQSAKTVLKITHFSCKLGLKIFFHRAGGASAPTAPPGMLIIKRFAKFFRKFIPDTKWRMAERACIDFQRGI